MKPILFIVLVSLCLFASGGISANECDVHTGWYAIFGPYCLNPVSDFDMPGMLPRDTAVTFDAYGGGTFTAPISQYYWNHREQRWWYIAFSSDGAHSWMFSPESIHAEG